MKSGFFYLSFVLLLFQSVEFFSSGPTLNDNANEKSDQLNTESSFKRFYKKVVQKVDITTVAISMIASGIGSFLMIKCKQTDYGAPVSEVRQPPAQDVAQDVAKESFFESFCDVVEVE